MKVDMKKEVVPLVVVVGMFIAGGIAYPYLPGKLPVHWNIRGEIDGFMTKNILSAQLFPLITLAMWILFLVLPGLDPKREKYALFTKEYNGIKLLFIVFFAFIYGLTITTALGVQVPMGTVLPCAIGVLFVYLGNIMGKIRQNYFVGFKLPWTLSNEDVWNRTHRFGGKGMMLSGVLTIAASFIGPVAATVTLLCTLGIMIAGTIIYSYRIHTKLSLNNAGRE